MVSVFSSSTTKSWYFRHFFKKSILFSYRQYENKNHLVIWTLESGGEWCHTLSRTIRKIEKEGQKTSIWLICLR